MKSSISFVGKFEKTNSNEWAHFHWIVNINGVTFDYKTGLAHATPKAKKHDMGFNKKPTNSVSVGDEWAHIPSIDSVLQCLFLDAEAGMESFNSFCDNFGYDNDSLKALDIYRACMESSEKLRKALGPSLQSERERIEALEFIEIIGSLGGRLYEMVE